MKTLTLIEMVRITRENGHRYCAVDKNGESYSYWEESNPVKGNISDGFVSNLSCAHIGKFNLNKTNWQDTLIDVEKIKVK